MDQSTRRSSRLAKKKEPEEGVTAGTLATIRGLVEEESFAKATKHLTSEGIASLMHPSSLENLRDLHPKGTRVHLGAVDYP